MPTAILAFISTNIDDILVLTLLLSAASRSRFPLSAGYVSGVAAITALSAFAAAGLQMFPENTLRLLGLVPILLAVRAWRSRGDDNAPPIHPTFAGAMLITLGSGADNLGVYIPLFARSAPRTIALSALTFLLMAVLWCALAARIASLPALRRFIDRRAHRLIPPVFILLGLYILIL